MQQTLITLEECYQHLIYPFQNESDLLKAIEEISYKFTQDREKISDYLKDPRLVSAYTAFYLMTNMPKLKGVMDWMPGPWQEILKKCHLIDLGAGPGTFSLAWKAWGGEQDIYQIETSTLMREQAAKLWIAVDDISKLHQNSRWSWKVDGPKLLLFGHSANEMELQDVVRYIKEINPEHVLFIEPGTKSFFPKMLEIRKFLIQESFNVIFPCPGSFECPLKGTDDWCHQFLKINHSTEVERLTQLAKKDRRLLPLTVHGFSRTFNRGDFPKRVVRVKGETKFSFEWDVCEGEKVVPYQVLKRGINKKAQKEIGHVLAGASIEAQVENDLDQFKRVKLIKINNKIPDP